MGIVIQTRRGFWVEETPSGSLPLLEGWVGQKAVPGPFTVLLFLVFPDSPAAGM